LFRAIALRVGPVVFPLSGCGATLHPHREKGNMSRDRNTDRNNAAATTMTSFELLENRQMFSSGGLDPSFSLDGKATVDFGNGRQVIAQDLAVQPDGKTVVVGFSVGPKDSFAIARFNVDGSLDRSFGPRQPDGRFLTSVGDSHSLAEMRRHSAGWKDRRRRTGFF
jgi:hypothetical protein